MSLYTKVAHGIDIAHAQRASRERRNVAGAQSYPVRFTGGVVPEHLLLSSSEAVEQRKMQAVGQLK